MKKKGKLALLLLGICILIVAIPLLVIKDSEFGGSDGAAQELISQIEPNYEPWAESILQPPGSETESLLFSLQAAIGSGVLCFGFGYLVARKKYQK